MHSTDRTGGPPKAPKDQPRENPERRRPIGPGVPGAGERPTGANRFDASHLRLLSAPSRGRREPYPGYFLLPDGWPMVAPVMALAFLLIMLTQMRLPPLPVSAPAVVAVVVAAMAPLFLRFERSEQRPVAWRYAAMLVAVVVPMAGFGMAMGEWLDTPRAPSVPHVLGAVVLVGLVASVALSGRLPALVAAGAALWAPMAMWLNSMGAAVMLVLGAAIALGAALRQIGLDHAAQAEQRELRRLQTRAESILSDYEQTGQGWFWETDRRGMLTYVSAPIGTLLGVEPGALMGRALTDLFVMGAGTQEGQRMLLFHLNAHSPFQELAVRAACRGEERWWSINGRPIYDSFNNFLGFRGSGSDLTEKRRNEQHAIKLARYDSLTGLANRFQMSQALEKILGAPHVEHRACAVFLLDLDRFKQVNDTLGHPAGDALLKQVAQRLTATVDELGRVGRLGGDEFQVILPSRITREVLADLSHRIIANLSQPYAIEGNQVTIGASVGIAMSPDDGVTSEAIIRNADLALYAAKDRGRGRYHFYDSNLHSDAEERRQLEQDLRAALIHGGLELYYQPIVHTGTEKITGFEALLRWNHPTRGRLAPGKFVEIAEETGLIAQVGEWALRTACHDLSRWPGNVRVAVNVSPLQFANPQLPSIVTNALASAQVAPERLELEITENVFLNDSASTEAMFAALKRVGVRLVLDDFGTGYSSLGYLRKAPFDKIKIDQGFVRGATMPDSRNGAIIASIVSLAEALGMETTAEGVETLDELDLVRELGCSHVQGYIYSQPMPLAGATARLMQGLKMEAHGPRSARPARRTMLRKVHATVAGRRVPVTIRNLSETGAQIEGLGDLAEGQCIYIDLAEDLVMPGIVRWSQYSRSGVEFAEPIAFDSAGGLRRAEPPSDASYLEALAGRSSL